MALENHRDGSSRHQERPSRGAGRDVQAIQAPSTTVPACASRHQERPSVCPRQIVQAPRATVQALEARFRESGDPLCGPRTGRPGHPGLQNYSPSTSGRRVQAPGEAILGPRTSRAGAQSHSPSTRDTFQALRTQDSESDIFRDSPLLFCKFW